MSFMPSFLISLAAVAVLFGIGYGGAAAGAGAVIGIYVPYAALLVFLGGLVWKVADWANSPVPFRIPTTSGQQKSLDWIRRDPIDSPFTKGEVVLRMALEVLFFRSLLKNTKTQLHHGKPAYATDLWLWLAAIIFHYSMLVVLLRHLRLFLAETPFFVTAIERADGFMQVGVPVFYATSIGILLGLLWLLSRRILNPLVRYISLPNDYFPLLLLLGIAGSGFCLRYIDKTDIVAVKELTVGLASFSPAADAIANINPLFFGHLFLVAILFAYFPFSKLMHLAGVFLSPTRNLANNSRAERHINPWNPKVKMHTYDEYEDDFRDLMKEVGLPVEKE